jgi:hypothetical protein
MSSRTSQLLAFVMIFFISLQSFAAAQMSVCNSMMQSHFSNETVSSMPCHEQMEGMTKGFADKEGKTDKTPNKSICTTLCSSLGAITVLSSNIHPTAFLAITSLLSMGYQTYTSVTLPSPQRPPILLS